MITWLSNLFTCTHSGSSGVCLPWFKYPYCARHTLSQLSWLDYRANEADFFNFKFKFDSWSKSLSCFCCWNRPIRSLIPTLCLLSPPGSWTTNDLHPVSRRVHQPLVRLPVRVECSSISVLSGVSDLPASLPAADWSQTSLHAQPAVLPGSHTDQVIEQKMHHVTS